MKYIITMQFFLNSAKLPVHLLWNELKKVLPIKVPNASHYSPVALGCDDEHPKPLC